MSYHFLKSAQEILHEKTQAVLIYLRIQNITILTSIEGSRMNLIYFVMKHLVHESE